MSMLLSSPIPDNAERIAAMHDDYNPEPVDSHCHIDRLALEGPQEDLHVLLPQWHRDGLRHMLCVNINMENFPAVLALAKRYPFISASVGVHPCDAADNEVTLETLLRHAADPAVIAIGETGLDYFKNEMSASAQQQRFAVHIEAARRSGKPLIIHCRAAIEDTLGMLKECHAEQVGGVMHCFAEDWATAQKAMALNFHISFSGIVTFANAQALRDVVKKMPVDRMLVETDAPYLAPVPKRGRSNIPPYVRYVVEKIAEIKQMPAHSVAEQTTANFYRLFTVASGAATA